MKIKKAASCLLAAALLAACQPTPAEDVVVNKGDGAAMPACWTAKARTATG